MAGLPFLDANIILRHLLQDLPDQSPRATAFIRRIEAGELTVRTTDTVIFEAVFVLERIPTRCPGRPFGIPCSH